MKEILDFKRLSQFLQKINSLALLEVKLLRMVKEVYRQKLSANSKKMTILTKLTIRVTSPLVQKFIEKLIGHILNLVKVTWLVPCYCYMLLWALLCIAMISYSIISVCLNGLTLKELDFCITWRCKHIFSMGSSFKINSKNFI